MKTTLFVLMLLTANTKTYTWQPSDGFWFTLQDCKTAGIEAMKHDAGPKPLPPEGWKCVRYRRAS